jgi:hypothetical protein
MHLDIAAAAGRQHPAAGTVMTMGVAIDTTMKHDVRDDHVSRRRHSRHDHDQQQATITGAGRPLTLIVIIGSVNTSTTLTPEATIPPARHQMPNYLDEQGANGHCRHL